MAQNRLSVNCLVQVKTDNKLDFDEWLTYHLALGFDTIFVCDSGNRAWLDELCEKKGRDKVVLTPRDERWQYKSDMISDYVSRREYEEWCICMDDHDFLWISPARARSIVEFTETIPQRISAVTFYVKHLSSKEPMRYRVGTQIDCFTHARREPEGFRPTYNALPNSGVTMFRVTDRKMPLRDPVTPVYANAWVDSEFRQMTQNRYAEETASRRFFPTSYSLRIYRYGIRSGVEMGFDDKLVPVGFDVCDLNMQKAREQYMHIPVNPDTETLFAKKEPPEQPQPTMVEAAGEDQRKIADSIREEQALPVSRARIDKLIFKGQFLDDVEKYVEGKDPNYDRELLARVFNEERQNIIKTSTMYTELQELLDQGKDDAEIRKTLCLTDVTLQRMKLALPVLDIKTEFAKDDEIPADDGTQIAVNVVSEPQTAEEKLVEEFDKSLEAAAPTAEELATREEALAILDAKAKPKTRKGTKKGTSAKKGSPKKVAVVAGSAKSIPDAVEAKPAAVEPAPAAETSGDAVMDELAGMDDSIIDDVNVDAVIASRQTAPEEQT